MQEENEINNFSKTNQRYANAFQKQAQINSSMAAWMPSMAAACSIVIIGYGGHQVQNGEIMIGDLVAFFMFLNMHPDFFALSVEIFIISYPSHYHLAPKEQRLDSAHFPYSLTQHDYHTQRIYLFPKKRCCPHF